MIGELFVSVGLVISSGLGFDGPSYRAQIAYEVEMWDRVSLAAEVAYTQGEKRADGELEDHANTRVTTTLRFGEKWFGGLGIQEQWIEFVGTTRQERAFVGEAGFRRGIYMVLFRYIEGDGLHDESSFVLIWDGRLPKGLYARVQAAATEFDGGEVGKSAAALFGGRF